LLEHLHFANKDILGWVDALALAFDLGTNAVGDELEDQATEVGVAFAGHDFAHLLANEAGLCALGVGSFADLVLASLGETNAEQTQQVAIGGLDINAGFDQRLPFADEALELVGSDGQTVEVGQAVLALDVVDTERNVDEGLVLGLLEIGEAGGNHTSLKAIGGDLLASCASDDGLTDLAVDKHVWGLQVIPVLLQERIGWLLLASLLSTSEFLVLADSTTSKARTA